MAAPDDPAAPFAPEPSAGQRGIAQRKATALRVWLTSLQRVARSAGSSADVWLPGAVVWLAVRLAERRGLLPTTPNPGLLARDCIARGRAAERLTGARLLEFEFDDQLELRADKSAVRKCWRDLEALLDLDASADTLGLVHERLLSWVNVGQLKRTSGSFFTPRGICDVLVSRSFTTAHLGQRTSERPLRVCDPAVGGGAFLLASYRQLVGPDGAASDVERLAALASLWGADISHWALGVTELSLWLEAASPQLAVRDLPCHLIHGDSLECAPPTKARVRGAVGERRRPGLAATLAPLLDDGGFDLVVGNPPWVAFAGRAAQNLPAATRRAYSKQFSAWRGYPTLHGLFVELAVQLAPRGQVALLLPSPIADLQGYAAVREVATVRHRLLTPLPELGQDAFSGVTQPCFGLLLEPSEQTQGSREAWRLEERSKARGSGREVSVPGILTELRALPSLPQSCFGERGFQSAGEISRTLFSRGNERDPFNVGLVEGRDVREFAVGPTRLFLNPDADVLSRCRAKLRPVESYQEVDFVVRQTASHPIAALHDGRRFRNTLLAGFAQDGLCPELLVGLLNSTLYRALHIAANRDARQRVFPQVKIRHLRSLPAPPPGRERESIVELTRHVSVGLSLPGGKLSLPHELRIELDRAVFDLFNLGGGARSEVAAFVKRVVPRALVSAD